MMTNTKSVDLIVSNINQDLSLLSRPEMERACLACLLVHPELMADIELELQVEDFFIPHHKILFSILQRLFYKQLQLKTAVIFDSLIILDHIKVLGLQDEYLNSQQGFEYLESLRASIVLLDTGNIEYYVSLVKDCSTKRKLYLETLRLRNELITNSEKKSEETLVELEDRILELHLAGELIGSKSIQIAEKLQERIQELMSRPRDLVGLSTGYAMLDQALLGIRSSDMIILTARYKRGKSAFLENIALNVAKQGIPVFMISTEMSDEEIQMRAVGNIADVDIRRIERGHVNDEEKRKIQEAICLLQTFPFHHIRVLDFNPEKIISLMRRFVYQEVGFQEDGFAKPCLVLFDYLKMPDEMKGGKWLEHEWQTLGQFCVTLKNAHNALKVPLFTAAQVNEKGGVAAASRLKWFCTTLLNWTSYEEEFDARQKSFIAKEKYLDVFKLVIELSRNNPENLSGIPFRFFKNVMKIQEDPSLDFGSEERAMDEKMRLARPS